MADITRTAAQVSIVYPHYPNKIVSGIAVAAIEAGQPVYIDTAGKYGPADANVSTKDQFRGIALNTVAAGQPVSVLEDGYLYGYTLSGVAFDGLVYVSDTVGELADAAGTASLAVGRVVARFGEDGTATKILKVTGYAG